MSLLDAGPHTVVVYPQVSTLDPDGNPVLGPGAVPITLVGVTLRPLSASENNELGQGTDTRYQLYARAAPLGPWAAVDWDGQRYDVLGEPARWDGAPGLAHVTAVLRRA